MVTDTIRSRRRDGARSDDGPDRGQVILIGAIALAFIVLGVVVVFNGVFYTETLSPGETSQSASDLDSSELEVRQGVACLVGEYDDDELVSGNDDELERDIETYSGLYQNATANSRPAAVDVSPVNDSWLSDLRDEGAAVTVVYDSNDVSHTQTLNVETTECPRGPSVDRFDVDTTDTETHAQWEVSGTDLSEVTITYSDQGRTETRTYDDNVSGTREDGFDVFYSDPDDEVQYVEILVEDDDGKTADERRTPE